ncbi:hypothetical protein HYR69_11320, partial [Candidatus Sumerlaeota bacterium]|nr:hypothetical protein [Candidatus Sumerlaeota bacterium]
VFPGLVYFIWRWHYFGLFLPLPFHLKAARGFLRGIGPTLSFFTEAAVILPAVFICMVSQANRKRKLLLLLAISLALLFLQPRHLMGYSSRYLYPIFPMLVALGFSAFDRKAIALRWYLIPLLLASNLISFREVREARAYAKSHISGYRAIVQTLDTIHADEPSLAIGSAGFVPYKTEWRAVDIFGLNNRAIALDAGAWRKELWDRPPTVIVLVSRREEVYETLADADIAYFKEIYDAAIERGYRAERKFKFDDEYFTWVLVMPGVEIPPPETKPEGRPPANP